MSDVPRTPPDDDPDPPPAEDDLVAYLDGELDPDQTRAVESQIALDPTARDKADALKKTYDLLDYLPRTEPSPNFTQRTLTRIDPPPAAASGPSSTAVPSVSGFAAPPPAGGYRFAAWVVAALLALGGGYLARAVYPPDPPSDSAGLAFSDVRVIENLPLTLGVDDLDFLRRLDDADLFPPEPGDGHGAAKPGSAADPVPAAQREALTKLFRSFPPARQQQLRAFDQQLHDLDPAARDHLTDTLERYAVWLDRLADPDRKEVLAAPSPAERFDAVRRVLQRAWRNALPASDQARLKSVTTAGERDDLVDQFRKQEADRRAVWEVARRQWDVFKNQGKPWPFSDPKLADEVDQFARTVIRPRLAGQEAAAFDKLAQELAQDAGQDGRGWKWFVYGSMLLALSERHRTLPEYGNGNKTVKTRDDLPDEFIRRMNKAAGPRKVLQGLPTGKWPEFAEAVAKEAKELKVTVGFPIGPSKPGEFTPAVDAFIATTLPAKAGSKVDVLKPLEGKWPEYPRKVLELAAAHDLSVPGVTLPGPPSEWARFYRPQRAK